MAAMAAARVMQSEDATELAHTTPRATNHDARSSWEATSS